MTRLSEALERSAALSGTGVTTDQARHQRRPGSERSPVLEFGDESDGSPDGAPMYASAQAQSQAAPASDAAVAAPAAADGPGSAATVCPYCGTTCDRLPHHWAGRWALVDRIRPRYRCRSCRRRFKEPRLRFSAASHDEPRHVAGFLAAEDSRSFRDLIRDMARDERDMWRRNDAQSGRP